MNKTVGYVFIILGVIIFLFSFQQISKIIKISLPSALTSNIIMVIGVVVLLVGAFIVSKGTKNKVEEVPIYQGKEVVGFRRIKR